MAKPGPQENPFGTKDQPKAKNIEIAQQWLAQNGQQGVQTFSQGKSKRGGQPYARVVESTPLYDKNGNVSFNEKSVRAIELNRAHTGWKNPAATQRDRRASGWSSTSSPVHTLNHEIGHMKDPLMNKRRGGLNPWDIRNPDGSGVRRQSIARRVSGYAAKDPDEFVAETYAGRRGGRRYDHQVMSQYYRERGIKPRSVRSQLKK